MNTSRTLGGVSAYRKRTGWARGVCTWEPCRKPVPSPRLWCGDACVAEYQIRNNPGTARAHTFDRDRGVCAGCGVDTEAIRRRLVGARDHAAEAWRAWRDGWDSRPFKVGGPDLRPDDSEPRRLTLAMSAAFAAEGMMVFEEDPGSARAALYASIPHLWEMDHVVEVVRGGGGCGLDNLQTLCRGCHRAKTARLAAERAAERRGPSAQVALLARVG